MSMKQDAPTPERMEWSDDTVTYDARDLVRDGVKANVVLDDQTYTLRITRAGKLILTK